MDVIFSFFSLKNKTDVCYIYIYIYVGTLQKKKWGQMTLCFSAFFCQVLWGNSTEKPASPEMDAELTVAVKPSHGFAAWWMKKSQLGHKSCNT